MAALSANKLVCLEIPSISPSIPFTSRICVVILSVSSTNDIAVREFSITLSTNWRKVLDVFEAKSSNCLTDESLAPLAVILRPISFCLLERTGQILKTTYKLLNCLRKNIPVPEYFPPQLSPTAQPILQMLD